MGKPWTLQAALVASLVVGGIIAGCAIVTGSTDGYSLVPQDAGFVIDAACSPDASVCYTLACTSSADCRGDSGASVCCAGAFSAVDYGTACVPGGSCPTNTFQTCLTDTECGAGVKCVLQECDVDTVHLVIRACGTVQSCLPVLTQLDAGDKG